MNATYGVSDRKISKNTELELVCPNCNASGTTEIEVRVSYFHLFWIPFMPIAKKGTSSCSSCQLLLDDTSFKDPITEYYNTQVSEGKTPIRLYTFTIILSLLIILAIALSVEKGSNNGLSLINDPKKLDGYVFIEDSGKPVEWTIDDLKADSVFFSSHNLETDDLIYRKYAKKDLIKMRDTDKLVKINRAD